MSEHTEKERQLALILELDKARDAEEVENDPNFMFRAIANILKRHFSADACAIMLVDETSKEIESIVALGVPDDIAIKLCRDAMHHEHPKSLDSALWEHTLGLQIVLKEGQLPLGSLFLARRESAFIQADINTLMTAESQIDSAIVQARLLWRLTHRSLELDAIYQIDQMRDNNPSESDLISGFTSLLISHFQAEFCVIWLNHVNSGEMILRGMMDKNDIPTSALDAIRDICKDLKGTQVIPTPVGIDNLSLLATSFQVGEDHLGAGVVGRKSPFTLGENRLLDAMTSQFDSAIVHSRTMQELAQRNRQLETIYTIDHIRDQNVEFDQMLILVLNELCKAVACEIGYLMLYNANSESQLELQATTQEGRLNDPNFREIIDQKSREALDRGQIIYSNTPEGAIRSIVAIPLILNDSIIGVFGAVNSQNARGFTHEDQLMLQAITSQVDTAIFERLERRQMRKVLSRSVDPKVLDQLLQLADDHLLAGERVELTVLFADLRGSTEWAERTEAEELVSILNTFLAKMTEIIFDYGGTLDKFVGDEIIALFGSPLPMTDHAHHAACVAVEMQRIHQELQAEFASQNRELPPLGIGISSGEVIAGEFGPPVRTDFTAMGRVMNLGSRLCSAAGAGQIFISEVTKAMLDTVATVESVESMALKGLGNVSVCELMSVEVMLTPVSEKKHVE